VFTPDDPHAYAVTNATVTLKVDALPDVSSLLTAHTQGALGHEVADQFIPEIDEREMMSKEQVVHVERMAVKEPIAAAVSAPVPEKLRETRAYKGAIYEKGDDGQWHRQQN
jgi:hypothetical protein